VQLPMRCLMLSAPAGVRRVARALPGLGALSMRAAASSACLAAWRAAQGAAPRIASRRFPPLSLASAFWSRARARRRAAGARPICALGERLIYDSAAARLTRRTVFTRDSSNDYALAWCTRMMADVP